MADGLRGYLVSHDGDDTLVIAPTMRSAISLFVSACDPGDQVLEDDIEQVALISDSVVLPR